MEGIVVSAWFAGLPSVFVQHSLGSCQRAYRGQEHSAMAQRSLHLVVASMRQAAISRQAAQGAHLIDTRLIQCRHFVDTL